VPMQTPGITVRAIPSLIGHGDIHEVFFDDVVVPATARLGEEGQVLAADFQGRDAVVPGVLGAELGL